MCTKSEKLIFWQQKIEHALENQWFIFHYQPIIEISNHHTVHYELLLRMQDEDGTIHSPSTFIKTAEDTGLINAIDRYVLQQGIAKQATLDKRNSNIVLSINLSGHVIDDPLLLPLIKDYITKSQADPKRLIFELTETAAIADAAQAKLLITGLNELGCRFSLDDFGSGFSSFKYLRELPVDMVKIDGCFITDLADSNDDRLFVKALVDVARGMGKKTVAEFVEKQQTLNLLHTFGIDYAQGYYIGKPEPRLINGLSKYK